MRSRTRSTLVRPAPARRLPLGAMLCLVLIPLLALRSSLLAQVPAIAEKTRGLEKKDGFIPLYYDPATGKLWMEISRFGQEFLYITGAPTGLGSNDIGLVRGQIGGAGGTRGGGGIVRHLDPLGLQGRGGDRRDRPGGRDRLRRPRRPRRDRRDRPRKAGDLQAGRGQSGRAPG